jgi:hypothetical protein
LREGKRLNVKGTEVDQNKREDRSWEGVREKCIRNNGDYMGRSRKLRLVEGKG